METAETQDEQREQHEPVQGEVLEDGTVVGVETPPPDEPEPEETEPEQPPPEPEPEPEQGYSEADLEAMRGRLDKEGTRHANRISEIMGEMGSLLVPCELCTPELAGFHWPAENEDARDELHSRLLDVLRNPAEAPLKPAPHAHQCPDCDGWGLVLSGSRKAENKRIACPSCAAKGYVSEGVPTAPDLLDGATRPAIVAAPDVDAPQADVDVWGSPRLLEDGQDNPNFGKMPNYKNPELP